MRIGRKGLRKSAVDNHSEPVVASSHGFPGCPITHSAAQDRCRPPLEPDASLGHDYRGVEPVPAVRAAARRPRLRLVQALQTSMAGYADRPTLGMRAGEAAADPATGRVVASVTGLRDHQLWRALVGGEGGRRGLE